MIHSHENKTKQNMMGEEQSHTNRSICPEAD